MKGFWKEESKNLENFEKTVDRKLTAFEEADNENLKHNKKNNPSYVLIESLRTLLSVIMWKRENVINKSSDLAREIFLASS